MIKGKKVLGVILARIGSKGVREKNIRKVCGHPLISYSILYTKFRIIIFSAYIVT